MTYGCNIFFIGGICLIGLSFVLAGVCNPYTTLGLIGFIFMSMGIVPITFEIWKAYMLLPSKPRDSRLYNESMSRLKEFTKETK